MTEPHSQPDELTETQRQELHALLLQARAEVERASQRSSDDVKPVSLDQPIGRLSRMDAMQQRAMAQASRRQTELRKVQIGAALKRFEEGCYGDCRTCDEPIGYKRLKSRPEAPFCIACQSAREKRR